MTNLVRPDASPAYPIFIPSKGRAAHGYTARALSEMRVPFTIIAEPQEVAAYREMVRDLGGVGRVVELDLDFKRRYDVLDGVPYDENPRTGSGPARNFAWHLAEEAGAPRHWVMDDNINGFFYYRENRKQYAGDGTPIRLAEAVTDRYTNVAMSGLNYYMFVSRKHKRPPITLNTRIYSCNLIDTTLPYRWRGRYNEDTILSLDLLKAGFVTMLFNAWLAQKLTTQTLPGGNTAELYGAGTLEKSKMLVRAHPDVARLADRFGRDHHHVDYRGFKQQPILRPDAPKINQPRLRPVPRTRESIR